MVAQIMSTYLPRIVDDELDEPRADLPAIAMEGPKGVGKTATARRRARTTILLDQPTERALLEADPERPAREPAALLHDTRTSTRVRVGSSECAYGR